MENTAEQLINKYLDKLSEQSNFQFYGLTEDYEESEENCYEVMISYDNKDDNDREWKVWFFVNENNEVLFDVCEGCWKKFSEADFWQEFAYRVLKGHKGSYCD